MVKLFQGKNEINLDNSLYICFDSLLTFSIGNFYFGCGKKH